MMIPNYLTKTYDLNNPGLISAFDEMPLWSAPFALKLLDKVQLQKNIKVLDIGTGTGVPLLELAMRLGNSSMLYGIDPWEAAMKRTNEKMEAYGISNVTLIHGVAEELPFENQSIDLITSNNGINNVADTEKVYKEIGRVSKQGAQFIQTLNLDGTMVEFYQILEEVLNEMNLHYAVQSMKEHIKSKRKPLSEILELCTNKGFQIKSLEEEAFRYTFANGTALFNHYFIQMAFMDSWIKLVPKEHLEMVFNEIESKLNILSEKNGYVQLSVPFVLIDCVKL